MSSCWDDERVVVRVVVHMLPGLAQLGLFNIIDSEWCMQFSVMVFHSASHSVILSTSGLKRKVTIS